MIEKIIIISLIITAIHVSMWDGMIFEKFRIFLYKILPEKLHMPFFDCLICMGGIYSLLLYPILFGFSLEIIPVMLCVIGLNAIIDKFLNHE